MLNKLYWMNKFTFTRKQKILMKFYLQFFILCVIGGVGSACFSLATNVAYDWCIKIYHFIGFGMLFYTPILFVLTAYILRNYFPYAGGSGLPQGYALDVYERDKLYQTYSLKTMFGKVILTFMSILGGASLGREGPTIQICASVFSSMRNISAKRKKFLIRIGSGIGIAAAFNAPLGGIVFAIEEYIQHSDSKMNYALLSGIAIAGYFAILITGDYSYMGGVDVNNLSYNWHVVFVSLFAGIVCGLAGALFTWLIVLLSVDRGTAIDKLRKKNYLLTAFIFGILVACLGLFTQGVSFGNGAETTRAFLNSNVHVPWYYAISKAIGALFSVAAAVPGGYFSTSLSIGAGLMGAMHSFLPSDISIQQLYLLGMVGFLAAITDAPITAVVMIISIVADTQHFAMPLVFTSVIAARVAGFFGESVYRQQVLIYVDKIPQHNKAG
ncbi:MAG: chloride channel protein [Neisseriaceae bacterium]